MGARDLRFSENESRNLADLSKSYQIRILPYAVDTSPPRTPHFSVFEGFPEPFCEAHSYMHLTGSLIVCLGEYLILHRMILSNEAD